MKKYFSFRWRHNVDKVGYFSNSQKKREQMRKTGTKHVAVIKLSVIHFKAIYSSAVRFLSFAGSA